MNPTITANYDALDTMTPKAETTEAFGWLGAMSSCGGAIGATCAGALADSGGGFVAAAVMTLAASTIAAVIALHENRLIATTDWS